MSSRSRARSWCSRHRGACHGLPDQGITAGSKEERADDRGPDRDRRGDHDQQRAHQAPTDTADQHRPRPAPHASIDPLLTRRCRDREIGKQARRHRGEPKLTRHGGMAGPCRPRLPAQPLTPGPARLWRPQPIAPAGHPPAQPGRGRFAGTPRCGSSGGEQRGHAQTAALAANLLQRSSQGVARRRSKILRASSASPASPTSSACSRSTCARTNGVSILRSSRIAPES